MFCYSTQSVQGVGGLLHSDFRAHRTERSKAPPINAIDGDLVELLLELSNSEQDRVLDKIPSSERIPKPELTKLVEDLQRMH